jgi:hypothetical protein
MLHLMHTKTVVEEPWPAQEYLQRLWWSLYLYSWPAQEVGHNLLAAMSTNRGSTTVFAATLLQMNAADVHNPLLPSFFFSPL